MKAGICLSNSQTSVVTPVCVLSHRRSLSLLLRSQRKRPIKIDEGELSDVVDNSGDIAGALATRISGAGWWRDDTSPAGYSGDCSGY